MYNGLNEVASFVYICFIWAISWQRPTTNIKPDMVCVKLIEITE